MEENIGNELKPFKFDKEDWNDKKKMVIEYKGKKYYWSWSYYDCVFLFKEEYDGGDKGYDFSVGGLNPWEIGTEKFCQYFMASCEYFKKKQSEKNEKGDKES